MARGALRERLQRDRFFQVGVALVLRLVLAATRAPWLSPFGPLLGDLRNARRLPRR